MSNLKLYFTAGSPPARAVLLLLRHLELEVEIIPLELLNKREQYSNEFLKLNPAHQVPTLIEDDFVLTESRAILTYLMNSKNPESDLYPKDPRKRAVVDQRLSFDHVLFTKNRALMVRLQIDLKPFFLNFLFSVRLSTTVKRCRHQYLATN